jgi:hypothetical protein
MVFLIDEVIMENVFNTGVNPVHTGIYIVDRGEKLGTPLRWFNADTGVWSRCEYTMEDILQSKDKPGALGFLPWRGPIKVVAPKVQPVAEVALVNTTDIQVTPKTKPAKAPKVKTVKVAKAPKVKTAKATHADGTITFREDRQKYMAWHGGKAEAARPTLEAAKAYLFKKYGMADAQMLVLV